MAATDTVQIDLQIDEAGAADEQFLADLFVAARPHLLLTGLVGPALRQLVDMQRRAQDMSYATGWPTNRRFVVRCGGEPVAMFITAESGAGLHLLDIAVVPAARGMGIGTRLIEELLGRGPVELMVAKDNPARRLYQRLGFVETSATETDVVMRSATAPGRST